MDSYWTSATNFLLLAIDKSKQAGIFVKDVAVTASEKWQNSSKTTKTVVVGTTAAVTAPLVAVPALGAVGFTSAGVAAGSVAATMQSATTVTGSIFALCQSAGAVGAVATSTSVAVGLTAGTVAGGVTALAAKNGNGSSEQGVRDNGRPPPHKL
ncbi:unnamed protein product [Adineta ricciae]|uniref:Uncharacterized protein n=1 Tax=Adineta ricciae TaxID=249248 RepID=A0A816FWV5_ADIRI|nr:unnamed protein product [Adineta ricciae]CAF1667192.1 unnamed protein product [Adineta ricciae]